MSRATKNFVIVGIVIVVILIVGIFAINALKDYFNPEPEITGEFISDELKSVSDLTTAELSYNGLIRYTEGKIPFITQKAFVMTYFAEVRAGIDMSKVDVAVTKNMVKIWLPNIEVQSVKISPDSISFYDNQSALFNWSKKEDVVKGLKEAEKDVLAKGGMDKLKERAKERTKKLVTKLFENSVGDKKLMVEYK